MRHISQAVFLVFLSPAILFAQERDSAVKQITAGGPAVITLEVPKGTPLPVVLENEVRIRKAGQTIHAKIAEPVYAFDKQVIPAGSDVTGSVTRIKGVSAFRRALYVLDANFTPYRTVEVNFDQLTLHDGRRMALRTEVSPASQGVLQFASAADPNAQGQKHGAKQAASEKVSEKKQEVTREWQAAKAQFTAPGKLHRLKRIVIAELPVHPQYFDAGTRFNAELLDPLEFGTEEMTPEKIQMVGTPPAAGSIIHALLKTPLSSANARKGEEVDAVMTEPLVTNNQLVLPEGAVLKGSVLQAQPARSLRRNGQLRIVFHQVVPPESAEQHVEASLEGVEVKGDENLRLDSEGGAQATTPKTRYLTTGISIALAVTTARPDPDAGASGQSIGEVSGRAASGVVGFRAIGFAIGALVKSRPLAAGMGAYGASVSIYTNFLSRGHDVVYPKDTAMAIGFGSRVTGPKSAPQTLLPEN